MSTARQPNRSTYFQTSIWGGLVNPLGKCLKWLILGPDQEKVTHFQTSNIYLSATMIRNGDNIAHPIDESTKFGCLHKEFLSGKMLLHGCVQVFHFLLHTWL